MNYEDFPILDNNTYRLMQEQYSLQAPDKHELVANIFNNLNSLIYCEIKDVKHFNKTLLSTLQNSKKEIKLLTNNLTKAFSINLPPTTNIKNKSIFSYSHNILSIANQMKQLEDISSKAYHKTILKQSASSLHSIILDILSALDNNTVYFFKYM